MPLFSEPNSRLFYRAAFPADWDIRLRYLGTAGFVFESLGHTIVADPYVSRPSLWKTATQKLLPDQARIQSYIPYADHVLVGHAHHDHILDAPELCRLTGAQFIGSRSSCNIARAAGLAEEQILETSGRETIQCGPHSVVGLPSRHGKVALGRVPLPGYIHTPPKWPMRTWKFRHGLVLNWHIRMSGVNIVHVDSADFIEEELTGVSADILCLCAAGRQYRPDYVRTAIETLRPKIVIPCHWDLFTTPLEAPPQLIPGIDLPGMIDEIRQCGAQAIVLPFLGEFAFKN